MAVTRIAHAGAAASTTLSAGISNVDTSISITAATGWPSGNPFFVVIDPSLGAEEKVLVTRSGTTLTATTRGADNTTAASHSSGATIYPCISALELDEANRLAAAMTTQGDIIIADASGNPIRLARGTTGQVLEATASTVAWGQVDTAGIADLAVTAAKIAANTITASEIAPDAVGSSELANNAVDTAAIADANVTLAKIASEQWTDYTPTLTQSGAVTKTVTYARYIKIGRWVNVRVQLDITGAGSAGVRIELGLPVTAVSVLGGLPDGTAFLLDASGAQWFPAFPVLISTTTVDFWSSTVNGVTTDEGLGADLFTAALASGDRLLANFTYEASA